MAEMSESEERTWAMFCHLGTFAGYVIPFGNIVAPLVIWLTKKEKSPFVDEQGRESLNFQISMTIYSILAGFLAIVIVGCFVLVGLAVFDIVVVIIASVKANGGERFRYPLTIRFIS